MHYYLNATGKRAVRNVENRVVETLKQEDKVLIQGNEFNLESNQQTIKLLI